MCRTLPQTEWERKLLKGSLLLSLEAHVQVQVALKTLSMALQLLIAQNELCRWQPLIVDAKRGALDSARNIALLLSLEAAGVVQLRLNSCIVALALQRE